MKPKEGGAEAGANPKDESPYDRGRPLHVLTASKQCNEFFSNGRRTHDSRV